MPKQNIVVNKHYENSSSITEDVFTRAYDPITGKKYREGEIIICSNNTVPGIYIHTASSEGEVGKVIKINSGEYTVLSNGKTVEEAIEALRIADENFDARIKAFEIGGEYDVAALEGRVGTNEDAINKLNDADNVEGSVAYAVKAEKTRAMAAESANTTAITTEENRAKDAEESLNEKIGSVETAYKAADTQVLKDAKSYTDEKVSSVYRYKGSVQTFDDLPTEDVEVGDVYNVKEKYEKYPPGTNFA